MADIFIVKWILAFSPILTVLVLMIFFNWSGSRAGAAGWFVALIAALMVFGAHPKLLAYSQVKGALLSLNELYVIWAALLLYHVVNETGAIQVIGMGIEKICHPDSLEKVISSNKKRALGDLSAPRTEYIFLKNSKYNRIEVQIGVYPLNEPSGAWLLLAELVNG